jgi:uncharacterized spore protein YtfJ
MTLRAFGALITTEVEYADLGEHHGRHLRGRVERRVIRVRAGEGGRVSVTLGRTRPVAVEVSEDGHTTSITVHAPAEPVLRLVQGIALLAAAAWLLPRLLARLRHTRSQEDAMDHPSEALTSIAHIPERASAAACFGQAASAGDRTVIPVAEVMYGMGVGWGHGEHERDGIEHEGGGGGGGGGSRVRAIAAIEVAPDGVRIHPIVDQTAVALAGITFAAAAFTLTTRTLTKLIRG